MTGHRRQRLVRAVSPYLLEHEILQNLMPATRGVHPLVAIVIGAVAALALLPALPVLSALAIGSVVAAAVATVVLHPVVLVATDHAVLVLRANWLDHEPVGLDRRHPRRTAFRAEDGIYAHIDIEDEQFWVPFAWAREADEADQAWSAVGRIPAS